MGESASPILIILVLNALSNFTACGHMLSGMADFHLVLAAFLNHPEDHTLSAV